ncbi:immunity to superinfection membrane protein [Serratia phage PS2]|uniref:Immunity to superinfection membrane protein n=1 Tax=Serratia phage PS2 TaxID=1481112 RepID=A0A023W649_9CAUD|nr:immunity to superinfection [Serratia phage PS2]AHY25296.1 immunity to superinfection membrane protein [Serratia phage PS2]
MIEGLVGLVVAFVVYMLPWVVALARKHKQTTAIFVGSLFTNWTGIGWVVMLIWSVMK